MVEGCVSFQKFTDDLEKSKLLLNSNAVETNNWNTASLDICGPLQASHQGNKYKVVMQNHGSNFLSATAVPAGNIKGYQLINRKVRALRLAAQHSV